MTSSRRKVALDTLPLDRSKSVPYGLARGVKAKKFIKSTAENGGATMDIATGKLYGENGPENAEAVGAEPSKITKQPIATHLYPGKNISGVQFAQEHERIKRHAAPGAAIGSWANNGHVEIDASRVFSDPMEASKVAMARDQDASFDFNTFSDVPYSEHAKRTGNTKPQNKKAKVELKVPSEAAPGSPEFEGK